MLEIMINGEFVDPETANISVMDHGFIFGDLVYEVVKTMDGAFFAARAHLNRLRYSASVVNLELPWDDDFLLAEMRRMVHRLKVPDTYLRLLVTRGRGPLSINPDNCVDSCRILYGKELVRPDQRLYEQGAGVWVQQPSFQKKGNIKSGVYRNNVAALKEAREQGCHEALLLNRQGSVAECTTSNIFWVRDGVLHTPALDSGILKGVTRQLVFHIAEQIDMTVVEDIFPLEDLLAADEVFITSTTRDIMPVCRVGKQSYSIGETTLDLMDRFMKLGKIDPSF